MRAHGPSAPAYVLLGLIRQTAGDPRQAEHYFNRAVYLQPDHYEALSHLALIHGTLREYSGRRRHAAARPADTALGLTGHTWVIS
jgi:chemotaxis protein methyltransferase WspC